MVPEDPLTALNPALRIGTQLRAVLRSHDRLSGALAPVAHDLFEQVQLGDVPDLLGRHPHELSGGQRQRVVIAFALAGGTSLLIADEATTALDVTTQLQILRLLRERNERTGLSLLAISHDLSVIAEICHEVCVMREGAIVERGSVDEVLLRPSHPYTRQLLAALPDPTKRGEPLGVGAPVNAADGRAVAGGRVALVRLRDQAASRRRLRCARSRGRVVRGRARRSLRDRRRVGEREEHTGAHHRRPAHADGRAGPSSTVGR